MQAAVLTGQFDAGDRDHFPVRESALQALLRHHICGIVVSRQEKGGIEDEKVGVTQGQAGAILVPLRLCPG